MAAGTHSAGIVLHRVVNGTDEILLVHPGGPFWAGKDQHAWSIPKGEFDPETEAAIDAASREFAEELGQPAPAGSDRRAWVELRPFRAGKKSIHSWLVEGDLDPAGIVSNHFEMEWPPRSGKVSSFPEVDQACWFSLQDAPSKLHKGQVPICGLIETTLGR